MTENDIYRFRIKDREKESQYCVKYPGFMENLNEACIDYDIVNLKLARPRREEVHIPVQQPNQWKAIRVPLSEIEDTNPYNPYAWNPWPGIFPPIDEEMRITVCIPRYREEEGREGDINYRDWHCYCGRFDGEEWIIYTPDGERDFTECHPDFDPGDENGYFYFRPWLNGDEEMEPLD